MKIKEYQKKFEDLFHELEKEHGTVAYVHIEPCARFEIPTQGVNETLAKCNIKFGQSSQ